MVRGPPSVSTSIKAVSTHPPMPPQKPSQKAQSPSPSTQKHLPTKKARMQLDIEETFHDEVDEEFQDTDQRSDSSHKMAVSREIGAIVSPLEQSTLASALNLWGKGQDHVVTGRSAIDVESGEPFDWLLILDGHGNDRCIHHLRALDWPNIVTQSDPVAVVVEAMRQEDQQYHESIRHKSFGVSQGGSTFLLAKVFSDRIVTINVGDSQGVVVVDGYIVFITVPHTLADPTEQKRVKLLATVSPSTAPTMIAPKKMALKDTTVCCFTRGSTTLVPTQALGHCGITGYKPGINVTPYSAATNRHVRVVVASDGFWDMHLKEYDADNYDLATLSAEDLLAKTESRWKQEWEFHVDADDMENFVLSSFPDNDYDDISIGVWDFRSE